MINTAPVQTTIGPLDQTLWSEEWSPSINPTEATTYGHLQTPNGLIMQMFSKVPWGGWLLKNVQPLILKANRIVFAYTLMIDAATLLSAQVIETDAKITDADGWLYDGSCQINIAEGWVVQVGAPWKDAVQIDPLVPYVPVRIAIEYALDYVAHTIAVVSVSVGPKTYPIGITAPAKQSGWARSQIVTQLQQCSTKQPGGYTLRFSTITYVLS